MKPCKTKWQQKWLKLDAYHPDLELLASDAEKFCAHWFNNVTSPSLLVIVGNFGSGKTHVAQSIFKFCRAAAFSAIESGKWGADHVPSSVYISWPEAAAEFESKNFSCMSDANDADMLVLDDVGAESDPWRVCADRLCQILSRREKRFTVLTTNISPQNWTERFDGRINDRLMRNSVIVDLGSVPSYSIR